MQEMHHRRSGIIFGAGPLRDFRLSKPEFVLPETAPTAESGVVSINVVLNALCLSEEAIAIMSSNLD